MNSDDTISISEAARRLNVSERTVYRLMKAGKLTRQYRHDTVRLLSDEVSQLASFHGHLSIDRVRQASDIIPEPLRQQIAEKDTQIAELLARQREMSALLDRLQEQLYELTRFVLSQVKPLPPRAEAPPTRGIAWPFGRRRPRAAKPVDKADSEGGEEA